MSTPTDIPTPRTDAHSALRDPASGHEHGKTVPTDFARQLERELHEANDEIMATDDLAYKVTKDEGDDPAHLILGRHIEKLTQELTQATIKLEAAGMKLSASLEDQRRKLCALHDEDLVELADAGKYIADLEHRIANLRADRDKDGREYVMLVEKRNAAEAGRLAAEGACGEMRSALQRIMDVCGLANRSAFNQLLDATKGAVQIAEEATESTTPGQGWLSPEDGTKLREKIASLHQEIAAAKHSDDGYANIANELSAMQQRAERAEGDNLNLLEKLQGALSALLEVDKRWTFDANQQHAHTWHDWADCRKLIHDSLVSTPPPTAPVPAEVAKIPRLPWVLSKQYRFTFVLSQDNEIIMPDETCKQLGDNLLRFIVEAANTYKAAVKEGP